MKDDRLKDSLKIITERLGAIQGRRELLLKSSRDVISLSARAIVAMHTGDLDHAREALSEAKSLLKELRGAADGVLRRYLVSPETEYVEAEVLLSIISKNPLPPFKALSVSEASYVLGMLDAIGEVKRLILDRIREGRSEEASELFLIIEHLYLQLSPLATYDRIAEGTKRKLDVARAIIEDARAVVTEEKRRTNLVQAIERLSEELGSVERGKKSL